MTLYIHIYIYNIRTDILYSMFMSHHIPDSWSAKKQSKFGPRERFGRTRYSDVRDPLPSHCHDNGRHRSRSGSYTATRLKTLKQLQDPLDAGNLPDRLLRLSRDMAQYLRHTGGQRGTPALDPHGWISVRVLRTVRAGMLYQASMDDIHCVVAESYSKERRRFDLRCKDDELEVRALHNHTLNVVISPRGRQQAYRDMDTQSGVYCSSAGSRPVPRIRPVPPLRLHAIRTMRTTIGSTTATTGSQESPTQRNVSPRRPMTRDGGASSRSWRLDSPVGTNQFADDRIRDLSCSELKLEPLPPQPQQLPTQPQQLPTQPQQPPTPPRQPPPQPQQLPPQLQQPQHLPLQPQQLPLQPQQLPLQSQQLPPQPQQPQTQPQQPPPQPLQLPPQPRQLYQQVAPEASQQWQQQQIQLLRERLQQYQQRQQQQFQQQHQEQEQQQQQQVQHQQQPQLPQDAQQHPVRLEPSLGIHAELRSRSAFAEGNPENRSTKSSDLPKMPVLGLFSGENYNFKCLVVQYGDVVEFIHQEGPWSLCRLDNEEGWLPTEFLLARTEDMLEPVDFGSPRGPASGTPLVKVESAAG
eukprot:GEMP01016379.1.p1 GENE.GEMP01016379.1~~GEMP01016379.1.p1  ORF type:complete len:579 (+),score=145.61 GEMP01016379.1:34-1770(+)